MDYFEIIILVVSFLAIVISLFTIWLAMMFYRLYSQLSLIVTEMSKGLEMSTVRLEKIAKLFFNQDATLMVQENDSSLSQQEPIEDQKKEEKTPGLQNEPESIEI